MATVRTQDWVSNGTVLQSPGKPDRTLGGRASLAWGTYFPDATTTGHTFSTPDSTITTNPNYSDMGAASPAKTFERIRYSTQVTITGKNYVFRNCLFDGPAAGLNGAMAFMRNATSEANLFEDCTFAAQTETDGVNGLQGRGFTLIRPNIYCVVDGVQPAPADGGTRTDVVIKQAYIHDLLRYSPDGPYSNQSDDQTHSDAIQWMGGLGLTLLGNRIEDKIDITKGLGNVADQNGTAALMINALNNTITPGELDMRKNWFRGGSVTINSVGASLAIRLAGAWEGSDPGTTIDGNWIYADSDNGHRWLKRAAQTQLDTAMAAGTNYVWNLASPLSTATVLPAFGVNLNT